MLAPGTRTRAVQELPGQMRSAAAAAAAGDQAAGTSPRATDRPGGCRCPLPRPAGVPTAAAHTVSRHKDPTVGVGGSQLQPW